jgi:thiol:disulfide interchange protein DsbD
MRFGAFLLLFISFLQLHAQDSTALAWQVSSVKKGNNYQLVFKATIKPGWQLYGPDQDISGTPSMELGFADSSITANAHFTSEGKSLKRNISLFDNAAFTLYDTGGTFTLPLRINGTVPGHLLGTLNFFYGKNNEFYSDSYSFTAELEGGMSTGARIRISGLDLKHPVSDCGDTGTEGKGLLSIFLLGLAGGFIALLTPCVFPLIPLTVSFFTKKAGSQKKGAGHALLYGFFIFLIYLLLSLPFHLLDHTDPEVLNNISTNVWLNLGFFVIFVVFAISSG